MSLQSAEVEITGTSPLLMHRFPLEPQEALEKQPADVQAEVGAYRDPDTNELYIPGVCVQRALIEAAKFSKGKGRASLVTTAAACFMVTPERCSLGTDTYTVDSRAVVMPATKGRIVRHRPRLDTWSITFTLEYDDVLLSATQVRKIVDDMGLRTGLLDFRPQKKGPFGRSMVTSWK